jgi:hypothetical protein|nr:MAG TPA: protein of unknown function DUF4313 [Caudoviricetes sp.]
MNENMETKEFEFQGKKYDFLRYKNEWVYPVFETYEDGKGSPIAMSLYSIDKEEGGIETDLYTDVTVNLPQCQHSAGCQFIDTNNNGTDIIDWLEQNKFGERTGNVGKSGFCTYPEFNFYKGENFWKYKKLSDEAMEEHKKSEYDE